MTAADRDQEIYQFKIILIFVYLHFFPSRQLLYVLST